MAKQRPTEILVVDDEISDLTLMCTILRREGYRVIPASGYLAGFNTFSLHAGHFDLLVTDVSLPDENGCELAKTLLAIDPSLRVLFVSGPSGAAIFHFYNILGPGIHYLEKPLNQDKFVKLIRTILEPGTLVGTTNAS